MPAIYQPMMNQYQMANPIDAAFKGFSQGFNAVTGVIGAANNMKSQKLMNEIADEYLKKKSHGKNTPEATLILQSAKLYDGGATTPAFSTPSTNPTTMTMDPFRPKGTLS
jgi:hypothetical protein